MPKASHKRDEVYKLEIPKNWQPTTEEAEKISHIPYQQE